MNQPSSPTTVPATPTPLRPIEASILTQPAGRPAMPQQINPAPVQPHDSRTAVERVVGYFAELGVGSDAALRLANTLDARIDPQEIDPGRRTAMMLEAFDRWSDDLPSSLGLNSAADRVAFVVAMHLGRLLNQHPEALDDSAGLVEALRPLVEMWPQGVLPNLPRQKMHRQPLGELPSVLQGEFWSGTYRWVVPVGISTRRMLRGGSKKLIPTANAESSIAAEGSAAGE